MQQIARPSSLSPSSFLRPSVRPSPIPPPKMHSHRLQLSRRIPNPDSVRFVDLFESHFAYDASQSVEGVGVEARGQSVSICTELLLYSLINRLVGIMHKGRLPAKVSSDSVDLFQ